MTYFRQLSFMARHRPKYTTRHFPGRRINSNRRQFTMTEYQATGGGASGLCSVKKRPKRVTLKCSLFGLPTWVHFYKEMSREIELSRVWMNHYEAVDFTVFEFGKRTVYLQTRLCLFTLTLISTCYVYPSILMINPGVSPAVPFVYMHTWLFTLLTLHQIFELCALTYTYYTIPTCVLVRMHQTPWYFKVTWFLHNTITANMMSCNFMYTLCFVDVAKFVGYFHMMCQVILTVVIGANVCVVGTPSRLTHVYQPVGLTFVHLLFSYIFQRMGLTNADGHNYVYKNLDWNNKVTAVLFSIFWLLLTLCCHALCVLTSWSRRVVFRTHRKKTKPVYGIDVRDHCPIESDSVHCPHHWKTSQHICCYKGCLSAEPVASPPYTTMTYDPHQSYREMADSTRRSPGEVSASKAKSWQEVQRGGADVSGEVWRVLNPRASGLTSGLTSFYVGATSESSQSEATHHSTTETAICDEIPYCISPVSATTYLGRLRLKRCLRSLKRKRLKRHLKVRRWSLKNSYACLGRPPVEPVPLPAGHVVVPGGGTVFHDSFDVERQAEYDDIYTGGGGTGGRRRRSSEEDDVSVDEDVESEDNDGSLDQDVDDSDTDSVFFK